jgi:hypothetical protein
MKVTHRDARLKPGPDGWNRGNLSRLRGVAHYNRTEGQP